MVCIYCGGETRVTNSRLQKKANQVWRRRVCQSCQGVFTTHEVVSTDQSLLFQSASASEPFSRDILLLSVYDSLRHRKTALQDASALTATIWSKLLPQIQNATIKRSDVVQTTTDTLKRFDKSAATHYAAFHPEERKAES